MTPTNEFRWHKVDGAFKTTPVVKNAYDEPYVLQQKWVVSEGDLYTTDDWRDVPLEKEDV